MYGYYEKKSWPKDAKSYEKAANFFSMMCYILGTLWLILGIASFSLAISELEESGLLLLMPFVIDCFLAALVIVFGWMMHGLSKVVLAQFEMAMMKNRDAINSSIKSTP